MNMVVPMTSLRITTCQLFPGVVSLWTRPHIPDWRIESNDPPDIPLGCHPAPECRITVDPITLLVLNPDVGEGRDKRHTVTDHDVVLFHPAEFDSIKLVVECEVHIN